MRYALISDIHANLPALEAVLADASSRSAETILHLGDLVGYAPWPDEVVATLAEAGIAGVAGNYDSTVAMDHDNCGCAYEDARQAELAHVGYEWTRANIRPETKRALGDLPFRLDVSPDGGHKSGARLVLVHGTPTLNTLYWHADRPDAFCLQMARFAGLKAGDVIAFGHTHLPWNREVEGIHFVNTGSVGRPKDGDWRAGYVMLSLGGGKAELEYVRVEYDVERVAVAILESELPDEFAEVLRTGGRVRVAAS